MPKLTRRDFLKMGAIGLTSAVLTGCAGPRRYVVLEPYVRPPEEQLAGEATWYASTCRQCPAGCGIIVRIMNGRALKIEGNPEHPLNKGKLCARGQSGLQVLYNPDRLPGPVTQARRGSSDFQPISWDEGLNTLYAKLQAAGGRVGIWTGTTTSGHLLDLMQRFAKGINAPAPVVYDLYSEINGINALAGASQTLFGANQLPAYNLDSVDVIVSFGADLLGTWISPVRYGIGYGAFRGQPLGKRGYLIQLEPRMTTTGAKADLWLPIEPGTEAWVAQALAFIIASESLGTPERIARAQALASGINVSDVATASGISVQDLTRVARILATADRPLVIPGNTAAAQGGSSAALVAIQGLNSISGAPSLTLSLDPPVPELIQVMPSSFADVRSLIDQMQSGAIDVLLVHGDNPVYELPEAVGFGQGLTKVPFVVSFSPMADETAVQADLILPDLTYLESWGYDVVSPSFGVPVVGAQQPVVTPVFDGRATADVLLTVARGTAAASALPWADEVEFLRDVIGALPPGIAGGEGTDVLWARFLQHGGWQPATTPQPTSPTFTVGQPVQAQPPTFQGSPQEYPYFLHLYMDVFLSDGRGADQPWLQGSPIPMTTIAWQTWVELHPDTAQALGVTYGDIVRVTSPAGQIEAPVYVYPAVRPDTVVIPLGQGHSSYGRYAGNRGANPMALVGANTDATGTHLSWMTMRVKVEKTRAKVALATFENRTGVDVGFPNEQNPG